MGDLISRKELIEDLIKRHDYCMEMATINLSAGCDAMATLWRERANGFRDAIDVVKGVIANNGWIPVTERLPERRKHVLTCTEFGEIAMQYYIKAFSFEGFTDKTIPNKNDISYGVVAWMELPEPYKEENQ